MIQFKNHPDFDRYYRALQQHDIDSNAITVSVFTLGLQNFQGHQLLQKCTQSVHRYSDSIDNKHRNSEGPIHNFQYSTYSHRPVVRSNLYSLRARRGRLPQHVRVLNRAN